MDGNAVDTVFDEFKATELVLLIFGLVFFRCPPFYQLPEMQKTMQDLSKEMMKMGLIGEMIDDSLDMTLGDADDTEEAVSAEVDKILSEITASEIAKVPDAVEDTLPGGVSLPTREDSVEEDGEINQMQARLAALRN